ncbi:hypothetical protein [Ruania zhangjianzhongii]|uniref:hypothetical protein n=1 Tax=Ruania zhangjianzhongii TaxID=2603206 RepID=UPI0011C9CA5E|nr:hypothetical protein [Ruania zhangjianzhongii]
MDEHRYPVPPEVSRAFTEISHRARFIQHMFQSVSDPAPGSNFANVDARYPFEKVSDRARHYVSSALEHLIMWADYAAPLKFHPEQTTTFTMRPAQTLARAALESGAQAVWLLDTTDPIECLRRHLSLIRWDLSEYRKSRLDAVGKARVRLLDEELVARVAPVFTEEQVRPPNGYLWVIQQACRPGDLDLDAASAERLWRAASGSAHGMYWTNLELTSIEVGEEYEPGHFRTVTTPDPQPMADVLEASSKVVTYAALKYVMYSGEDPAPRIARAREWLAERVPLKPGAAPDVRNRLASGVGSEEW